jgi:solute carrier family 6 amino acid transporter-like protein 5/7/9/14
MGLKKKLGVLNGSSKSVELDQISERKESKPCDSESVSVESGDENKERGNWTGKLDFLLSAIGFAVGLGNVWRFPHRAYSNGGGSFLIPYAIMLFFAGLPLFFMEMSLGQFSSLGPISVWNVVPAARGLGVAMVIISALVCIYYNMIIAYTLYYLFASFTSKLPWTDCKQEWIDKYKCTDEDHPANADLTYKYCAFMNAYGMANSSKYEDYKHCEPSNSSYDGYCSSLWTGHIQEQNWTTNMLNATDVDQCVTNFDWCRSIRKMKPEVIESNVAVYNEYCLDFRTPSDIYWEHEVLDISEGFDKGQDEFRWSLVLCLLLAWIIIFLCLIKGIKSSGKVVYVTATFPYVVLIILLIRNVTLEGAQDGIDFYITPEWDKLTQTEVWYQAAIQIFYSLGVAFGGLETMASYNRFHNNVHRDSWIVAILNCATSVFAGFVIFSVIGHMSYRTGQDVDKVAAYGPGLAFVAYPAGLALMPAAPFWSILFFLMLFTLGLDSQFAMMETVITAISDIFPVLRESKKKAIFTFAVCSALFLLGLPQCARNGVLVMNLFDWYSAGFSLLVVSIFECLVISYCYGVFRFKKDLHMMLGPTSTCNGATFNVTFWTYWFYTWVLVTPGLLIFTLAMYGKDYIAVSYNDIEYPAWADGIGWLMVVVAVIWIPIVAVYELAKPFCENFGTIWVLTRWIRPRPNWGPALDRYRTDHYEGTSVDDKLELPDIRARGVESRSNGIQDNNNYGFNTSDEKF